MRAGDKVNGRVAAWVPQPRQAVFMARGEDEVLFGGAAGGGKSDALVAEALRQIHIPHYKGLLLRRTYPQLMELIDKAQALYPLIDPGAKYNASQHFWKFSSGAKVVFGSVNAERDKYKYQGQAYDFIGFDELTHFTASQYDYIGTRCRPNGPGTRCYVRATANPGGVGHGWVKERFITPAPPMTTIWQRVRLELTGQAPIYRYRSRIFIPSKVTDNPALMENDPMYVVNLASKPEAERRALLYGDWDSYQGQVFSEWKNDPDHYEDRIGTHVIEPFEPPMWWRAYRSFDWGYSKPFSCGWWVVDGEGVAYRIAEYYGCKEGVPDTGLCLNASAVFEHIAEMEKQHPLLKGRKWIGVADPAIFAADGGESIASVAAKKGIYFSPGDHQRIAGWAQLHERLAFDDRGRPRMYIFKTCRDFIRTVPALVYDESRVEDVDTSLEDHIADETRYFCMMNPVPAMQRKMPSNWAQNPLSMYLDIKEGELRRR